MADMEDLFGSEAESEAERKGAASGRAGSADGRMGCRVAFRPEARRRAPWCSHALAQRPLHARRCQPLPGDERGVCASRARDQPGLVGGREGEQSGDGWSVSRCAHLAGGGVAASKFTVHRAR